MKKIFVFVSLVVILAVSYFVVAENVVVEETSDQLEKEVLGQEIVGINKLDISSNENTYTLIWYEVENLENIKLIPNFTDKTSSSKIAEKYNCEFLTNAGFYSEDSKPIGYFVADGEVISGYEKNSLLNGILSINYFDTPRIMRSVPQDEISIGFQSGPVLIENGGALELSMARDQNARRIIAATTGSNELIFMVVYDPKSLYSGPKLAEMKVVLKKFEDETEITLADAINLDGGTASTFYISGESSVSQKAFELSELSPVGSFFCVK